MSNHEGDERLRQEGRERPEAERYTKEELDLMDEEPLPRLNPFFGFGVLVILLIAYLYLWLEIFGN